MKLACSLITVACVAGGAHAVTITVSDSVPNGDSGSGTRSLSSSQGIVSAPPLIPTTTYTVTGLDLTSVGGSASETIAFDITYSQSGGTGVQFNGFGNVSVTGGNNSQVEVGETLTATVSLNSTTFGGQVDLGLTSLTVGGRGGGEDFDVVTENGTTDKPPTDGGAVASFDSTTFATLTPVVGDGNIQAFTVTIDAVVPEPSSLALLGLGGLCIIRRRRA